MFAATIGFFDGVHLGHRYLISQVCDIARARGLRPLVVTFDCHPRQVIDARYSPSLLTTAEEKLSLLRKAGIEEIRVLHFDKAVSMLSARDFMLKISDEMDVRALVMGYDHHFGHDGGEGVDYATAAAEANIELVRAHELPNRKASSSEVRRLLRSGNVEAAAGVLGYDYRLGGEVVHGRAIGRLLGFPTANVRVVADKLIPACGVYAARVTLQNGIRHICMLNIGHRPTINDDEEVTVEACILGYEGNLYGENIEMELVKRLRDECRFGSAEALSTQLEQDALRVRALLG